jgi:hypothetical protein
MMVIKKLYLCLLFSALLSAMDQNSGDEFSPSSGGSESSFLRKSSDELSIQLRSDEEIDAVTNLSLREAIVQENDAEIMRIIVDGEKYDTSDIQMGLSAHEMVMHIYTLLKTNGEEEGAKKYAEARHLKFSPEKPQTVVDRALGMRAARDKELESFLTEMFPAKAAAILLEFKL